MSVNPNPEGPTTFRASGVVRAQWAGTATTDTLRPYRISSVVMGYPARAHSEKTMDTGY